MPLINLVFLREGGLVSGMEISVADAGEEGEFEEVAGSFKETEPTVGRMELVCVEIGVSVGL